MNDSVLTTIAITGFGIAFFHAAIPTHWLPFVLTARAQRWNRSKTLIITAHGGDRTCLFHRDSRPDCGLARDRA